MAQELGRATFGGAACGRLVLPSRLPSSGARPTGIAFQRCRAAKPVGSHGGNSGGSEAAEAVAAAAHEALVATSVSFTQEAAGLPHAYEESVEAEVDGHAFVGLPPPSSLLSLDPLRHASGASSSGPFPTEPLGAGGGWVWAAAVLLAARLGRVTAQEARLDVRKLQFERERSRALSKDLREARDRWRSTEAERLATEDGRRVEETAAKARQEVQRAREEQRRYQEATAKEKERLRQKREVERREYEQQQAQLDAEASTREEQARVIIEQQRAAERAAQNQRRRAEEERQRKVVEERRQREEEEQRQREKAIRAKLEERRRLEGDKKKFGMRLEGSLAVERPPKGTVLPGPLQKEASVRLSAVCSTLLGGPAEISAADFASLADASEALPRVAGQVCRQGADAYSSAMRLQSMAGEGVLQWIDDTELQHWACTAAARAALAAVAVAQPALKQFQQQGSSASKPAVFQCRTDLGVLPTDHPKRTDTVLRRVIASIESGDSESAGRVLDEMLQVELELFQRDLPPCPGLSEHASALMAASLLLSHLLSRALAERPWATSDAPAWFEATARAVRGKLAAAAAGATKDSLQLPAALMAGVLGSTNPVAEELARLAEGNLSAQAKKERQERERRAASELAAKLVDEEWPDATETKKARRAEQEAKTPVPERCWALRNVAGTLSMGSPGERARARKLLEQAVLLKQEFAGAPDHPAVLPELIPLAALLASDPEWKRDATGVSALILGCLGKVAAAYRQACDSVSAAILLEAALRRFEEVAGVRHPSVKAAMRGADAALEGLSEEQRQALVEARPKYEACIARVVAALTDELAAYQQGSPTTKVQRWDSEGVRLLGPLH